MGSTFEEYAGYIKNFINGFGQSISIASAAYNKTARKDIITNYIKENNLILNAKNKQDTDNLINNLIKLTDGMSFVEIKAFLDKTKQIMFERNLTKVTSAEFNEAYLQTLVGRTSKPEMPEFNKRATTSHECGHATNLEVMGDILKTHGKPWHQSKEVNFITLDPRGNFLGAVFAFTSTFVDVFVVSLALAFATSRIASASPAAFLILASLSASA